MFVNSQRQGVILRPLVRLMAKEKFDQAVEPGLDGDFQGGLLTRGNDEGLAGLDPGLHFVELPGLSEVEERF